MRACGGRRRRATKLAGVRVEWFGQSAFRLEAGGRAVVIDPFVPPDGPLRSGIEFGYPALPRAGADLVLVTHEHFDHNGVEAVTGEPAVLRSTAGRLESPIGEVVAVASEHDELAGTRRGPNTIFVFTLDGVRVCHFGDFGQRALRGEQAEAIGAVDLLLLPVGGTATIGPDVAAAIVERLAPRWVVPMHYRTPRIGFLEPADAFLDRMPAVHKLDDPGFDTDSLEADVSPTAIVPSAP